MLMSIIFMKRNVSRSLRMNSLPFQGQYMDGFDILFYFKYREYDKLLNSNTTSTNKGAIIDIKSK